MRSPSETPDQNLPAILLAGGQSRRMGRDKAALGNGPSSMRRRIEEMLAGCSRRVFLVLGRNQTAPPDCLAGTVVLQDEQGHCGPLEGLRVGLHAVATVSDRAWVVPCDAPGVTPALLELLAGKLGSAQAVMPCVDGRLYPLTAAYHTSAAATIEAMLRDGDRRAANLADRLNAVRMPESELRRVDPHLDGLQNVNTPEAYAAWVRDHVV